MLRNIAALAASVAVIGALSGTGAARAAPPSAPRAAAPACDRTCLIQFADRYMQALAKQAPAQLPWAKIVEYSENDVPMIVGDGNWATVVGVSAHPLYAADPSTGNVAWFGTVSEHGQPAFYGMRMKVEAGKIAEVEAVIDAKYKPGPFGDPDHYVHDPSFNQVLPANERSSRAQLIDLVDGYYSTMQRNDGEIHTRFDPNCERMENGVSTTQGKYGAAAVSQGCESQFKLGLYKVDDRVRDRRFPIVDVNRGVVVATAFIDHAARFDHYKTTDGRIHQSAMKYPNSLSVIEMFKIRSGAIYRIEAIFTLVPYFMPSPWVH